MCFTGCKKKDVIIGENGSKNHSILVTTVGKSKIYLDEMMYYIFMNEYQLNQYDQVYQSYMGKSYWDTEYTKGVTMREFAKTSTLDNAVMYEILYDQARKEGYQLTTIEKKNVDQNVKQFMQVITKEQLKKTGLTEQTVRRIVEKLMLADRYRQDLIDALPIDDQSLTAKIDRKKYRQYNTECLFIATTKKDQKGKEVEVSEAKKASYKKKMEAVLQEAKAGKTFAEIAKADEMITTTEKNFVAGDQSASEEYQKAAMPLKNKEITDVVTTKEGYYVIRMKDNDSDESYQKACKEAITKEEEKQFNKKYEKMKQSYPVKVEEAVWKNVVMGKMTLTTKGK